MRDYIPSGFFVLRTPLLPFWEFFDFMRFSLPSALRNNTGDLTEAVAADRALIRARLQELAKRPEVKEALWVASPDFYDSLAKWWVDPESKKGRKIEQSLYRYVARVTSRATPFGLCAGWTTGRIGEETRLSLAARGSYGRRSRLDMGYLCALAEKIISDPVLRKDIRFHPNTSLYSIGDRFHHVQSYYENEIRLYRLVATDHSSYLEETLLRASSDATLDSLAHALVKNDLDISIEEANKYLEHLIESQVLVSDLIPPIAGPDPLADMIDQLTQAGVTSIAGTLVKISNWLQVLDACGVGSDLKPYHQILNEISQLPVAFRREHVVQVDTMKPALDVRLDQHLIDEILRGVDVLHRIIPTPESDSLSGFKKAFRERYQDQEIPLLEALDEECGVGFGRRDDVTGSPESLLDGIDLIGIENRAETETRFTKSEMVLIEKVTELLSERETVLNLDSSLLEALQVQNPLPLPNSFAVLGIVCSLIRPKVENRNSFYLESTSGPCGANLMGRFCYADDLLKNYVLDCIRAEEQLQDGENPIFAEVTHLPEGRTGNILYRPILRRYEIPYLSTSRIPSEQQIAVADLSISIINNRIVLRSRKFNREILPRLTTAHAYSQSRSLPTYKFLCLLQSQGLAAGLSWNWGMLTETFTFLPRVVVGNVGLSPARWLLTRKLIEKLASGAGTTRLRNVQDWREKNRVPRFAYIVEMDNRLLIDFDNVLSVETFAEYIKKRPNTKLAEMLPDPGALSAAGPEGVFVNEVIIPFTRVSRNAEQELSFRVKEPRPLKIDVGQTYSLTGDGTRSQARSFVPGSEWSFLKIYGGPSQLDRLLVRSVKPLVDEMLLSGNVKSWFFVRYGDPHWHLRVRFWGDPAMLNARVLPSLLKHLELETQQKTIWRVQLDTYEREVERYGGPAGMTIAERLFHFDSQLIVRLIHIMSSNAATANRWKLALYGVDSLLSGLGLDISEKFAVVGALFSSYGKIFDTGQNYQRQVAAKFRKEREMLEQIIEPLGQPDQFPPEILAAFRQYSEGVMTIREQIEEKQRSTELTKSMNDLAKNYVHMHLNRMFRSAQNAQEVLLYDFLTRLYDSKLARRHAPIN